MSQRNQRQFSRRNLPLLTALQNAGLTGYQCAEAAGVSHSTFSAILCDRRRPTTRTAERIANVLQVQVEALFPKVYARKAFDRTGIGGAA